MDSTRFRSSSITNHHVLLILQPPEIGIYPLCALSLIVHSMCIKYLQIYLPRHEVSNIRAPDQRRHGPAFLYKSIAVYVLVLKLTCVGAVQASLPHRPNRVPPCPSTAMSETPCHCMSYTLSKKYLVKIFTP